MTSRLFVYGTLRNDNGKGMFHLLARNARSVGRARVQGRLFHLGEYPGLVPSRDSGLWVHGEVYALENPPDTLARLDAYEGCGPNDPEPHEFERVEKDVVLESGTRDNVWVYEYRGSTTDKKEILSGDYFKEALNGMQLTALRAAVDAQVDRRARDATSGMRGRLIHKL